MKKTKIFMNGDSQAVRLPKEFRFAKKDVYIQKFQNGIIILPIHNPWEVLENSLDKFTDDLFLERNQPPVQKRDFDF